MNSEPQTIYELRTTNHELRGFSLAETLIALGILAVGMIFIAGVFPVAIQLATVSTERTIATIVVEEAFAKVKLYGMQGGANFTNTTLNDFNDQSIFPAVADIGEYEFTYPSNSFDTTQKQYCWSALCRETAGNNSPVQVTVFICRKAGRASTFHINSGGVSDWPAPCSVPVSKHTNNQLRITDTNKKNYVNDDYTIVDDDTGQIYRVVRRLPATTANPADDEIIQLDRAWQGTGSADIWVVPPVVGGGRNPCIAVYQKEIKF